MEKKTIIFILAPPKSGSTLLQILLSSHNSTFSLGERIYRENYKCSCGHIINKCTFWSKILNYNKAKEVDNLDFFNLNSFEKTSSFYKLISLFSKKNFIIDNSKNTKFLRNYLISNNDLNVKIISLIRNPIEIVEAQKKKRLIHNNTKGMSIFKTSQMTLGYTINQFLNYNRTSIFLDFHTLSRNPLKEINKIFKKLGLSEVSNLNISKEKTHLLGGSGFRGNYNKINSFREKNLSLVELIYSVILNIPSIILIKVLNLLKIFK